MKLARWRKQTEWPLAAVAVVFLIAYSWEVIADLEGPHAVIAETVINVTWAVFVLDYLVQLVLAERRWRWFRTHLFDLAVVALPALRPLRLLRLVTLLAVLHRTTNRFFRGRIVIYAAGASLLLIYVAALAELDAERSEGTITNFAAAIWWACVTMSTVGYGDYVPVTIVGRLVAIGVMIGGIALIGVITATLASWIVERVAASDRDEQQETRSDLQDLADQVAALREEVRANFANKEDPEHPSG